MSTTSLEAVEAEAMKLSPRERADLAERLWMSVPIDEDHDAAWDAEISRSMAEVDSGAVTCRPWSDAMRDLRAKFG